ncbi:MAG TPA: nicotinate-nucleotide--dimethylbenzimidazole phosphoribosyltransferase [Kofleriaceae bacterium]|nr:nicotinate-nucleotide--dimethylbenzimidazole phosphoribosyltransferase [Kofleriaceae bacterium]
MTVLRHVIDSITAGSPAHGAAAARTVAAAGAPVLTRLAHALGAAQHTARPRVAQRSIVVVAGDHGIGDPGVSLGAAHPTVIAAHAIADGTAALAQLARTARAPIVLATAGVREPDAMPAAAIQLALRPSRDLMAEPALTPVDAALALEAGIALLLSIASGETASALDVVAVGALGLGAEVASAALLGAATGVAPTGLGDPVAEAAGALGAAASDLGPLERLAAFGGPELGVLAGVMLAAASIHIPVVLDGFATATAALIAAGFAPRVTDSLIAAHAGGFTQPRILAHLGLHPLLEVGLGHGEGTGAALILPWLDQVAALR